MKKTKTVRAVCESCGGTGLYNGFMEAPGEAVVCVMCNGTGCETITYVPFERRKGRRGIKQVRFGSGLILDTPTKENWFTYKEFQKMIPEKKS